MKYFYHLFFSFLFLKGRNLCFFLYSTAWARSISHLPKDRFVHLANWLIAVFILYSSSFLTSCKPNLDIPEPNAGEADFSSTVAIGGNYLAGYQDGALYDKGQKNSIPSLLAARFQLMKGSDCLPPMIPDDKGLGINSKPWESAFVRKSALGYKKDCLDKESLSPLKELFGENEASAYFNQVNGTIRNMAVPFATIKDFFTPALGNPYGPANPNPFYRRFASDRGISTVFSDALKLDPSFAIVWVGMEDIYEYAKTGGYGKTILPVSEFSKYLGSLLKPLSNNGAKGVIANIPELKSFPFFSLIPWDGLDLTQSKADSLNDAFPPGLMNFQVGKNGFMIEDALEPFGFRKMRSWERILLSVPVDSMKCYFMGSKSHIPDRYVLDENEKKKTDQAILDYNEVIFAKAIQYGFAFVDMKGFFKKVASGIKWDGVDYNTSFVSGGFFSLDGYHPNQKGYEMIANEFVDAINKKYTSVVPSVYCSDCTGILFP